jgi:23S rRNA (cytosine1962-C5)-methyltransferase
VTSIDSSGPALAQAAANVALNGFDAQRASFLDADVNASLRQFDREGQTFDAIVLDPPKFAPTAAHAERAARAYKDINRLAFKLLAPDGVLFTCFTRSSPRPAVMPGWTASSPNAWVAPRITR